MPTEGMSLAQPEIRSEQTRSILIDLHNRLDALWTAYLHNLDQYAAAQKTIQQHMSAGSLSLARANFNARNGVRRYGKDFFHERAIASKRVEISGDRDDAVMKLTVVGWDANGTSSDTIPDPTPQVEKVSAETKNASARQQQPSPPTTPSDPEADGRRASTDDSLLKECQTTDSDILDPSTPDAAPVSAKSNPSLDPLRWFGILVPPDLRTAQASFVSVVDGSVADAVNAARRMRALETEIRRLRKEVRRAEKMASS